MEQSLTTLMIEVRMLQLNPLMLKLKGSVRNSGGQTETIIITLYLLLIFFIYLRRAHPAIAVFVSLDQAEKLGREMIFWWKSIKIVENVTKSNL
jgi:hypothetical protein